MSAEGVKSSKPRLVGLDLLRLVEGTLDVDLDPGSRLAMYFVGSFGLGIAMAKVVEVPALRVRDR